MKNYGRSGEATDFNIRWRTRFAWLITKATDTHPEYVTIIAFRRQKWLSGRVSNLCLDLLYFCCYIDALRLPFRAGTCNALKR